MSGIARMSYYAPVFEHIEIELRPPLGYLGDGTARCALSFTLNQGGPHGSFRQTFQAHPRGQEHTGTNQAPQPVRRRTVRDGSFHEPEPSCEAQEESGTQAHQTEPPSESVAP